MFDIDKWQEIFHTIGKNKLRTFLTALSVIWGIFMLVFLLGAGNGLQNGAQYQFRDTATNSIWVFSGQTSTPYKGLQPGRYVRYTNDDFEVVKNEVSGVDKISGRFYLPGSSMITYGAESGEFSVRTVHPEHQYVEKTITVDGRFINENDIKSFSKVTSIGTLVRKALFKEENPIGKYIKVNGVPFQVIGVFEDEGGEGELEVLYLPISTAQRVFNGKNRVHQMMFTIGDATLEESKAIEGELRQRMAERHNYDPEDQRAIRFWNNVETSQRFTNLFKGINLFIWFIGICTIIAGVVGISNIMMIVVKERTKEFGVRKALGATPASIISLILMESILVTSFSGYIGLLMGVGIIELFSTVLPPSDFFRNPQVDIVIAIKAIVLLVVAGAIAGLIPAYKAARIKPIVALRDE